MKHKSKHQKGQSPRNESPKPAEQEHDSQSNQHIPDNPYTPWWAQGAPGRIYLDEIVVYYSLN